ncbi:hypothetical protein LCGC14_1003700 [marine sediment metagenome]|uniref:Homing endonuclease LAGLIDADG domain-containing protein n=1 Tax=marine sediment metagenome TaxID=412755 RepID=A0A0F9QKM5_9ZZZZ
MALSPLTESLQEIFLDPYLETIVGDVVAKAGGDVFAQVLISSFVEGGRETLTGSMSQFIFGRSSNNPIISTHHQFQEIHATSETATRNAIENQESFIQIKPKLSSVIKTGASLLLATALVGFGGPMFFGASLVAGVSAIRSFSKGLVLKTVIHNIVSQKLPSDYYITADPSNRIFSEGFQDTEVTLPIDRPTPSQEMIENTIKLRLGRNLFGIFINQYSERPIHFMTPDGKIDNVLKDARRESRLASDSYSTLELIEDLRNEIQTFSEELALLFPERLVQSYRKYTHKSLSHLIERADEYVSMYIISPGRKDSDYVISEKIMTLLEEKIAERLGAKALGCMYLIEKYKNREIDILQFIKKLEAELGRVSGDIGVTDTELSLILAGTRGFIKHIKGRITSPRHKGYNLDYKFSKERLEQFRGFIQDFSGGRAIKAIERINKFELLNPDLKEYSGEQVTITNPNFFKNLKTNPAVSYWYGFLRADGSISVRYRISIELSVKDKDRLIQFADAVGLDRTRIKERIRYHRYKGDLKGYTSAYIQFESKSMHNDLVETKFQSSKSVVKSVPNYVKESLSEAKKISNQWWTTSQGKIALSFLLGFYDGDGHYKGGKSAVIYSASKMFLEDVKKVFGIKNRVLTSRVPGETAWIFDREYTSKGFYSLSLGPRLFDMMMDSYYNSMKRKRPSADTNLQNFLGDLT